MHQSSQFSKREDDLRLLAIAVNYFAEMRPQMRLLADLCSKLQHTAAVFLHLAQSHIRHCTSTKAALDADPLSEQLKTSEPDEQTTPSWNDLINIDLNDDELITYLNCLPVDMDATSRILENELQFPQSHHSDYGEESSPTYLQKPILDCTFGWFLWDDYYGSSNMRFE